MRPTAYTLNGLLNVEMRADRPLAALGLLKRAKAGAPRWPGHAPDAWSYRTAMAAAKQAGRYQSVGLLFDELIRHPRLRRELRSSSSASCAHNLALEALLRQRKLAPAKRLYQRMADGEGDAPPPRAHPAPAPAPARAPRDPGAAAAGAVAAVSIG